MKKVNHDRTCFFICPLNSKHLKRSNTVMAEILDPACKHLGLDLIRMDHINTTERIDLLVTEYLEKSAIVVADLSNQRHNVMWEAGYRTALKLPLIHLCADGQDLPFDIRNMHTIFYKTDVSDIQESQNKFQKILEAEWKIVKATRKAKQERQKSTLETLEDKLDYLMAVIRDVPLADELELYKAKQQSDMIQLLIKNPEAAKSFSTIMKIFSQFGPTKQ